MTEVAAKVRRMTPAAFADVVATLCDAFRDYPVMRYVLKDAGAAYDEHLAEFIGYFTESRFSRGWPVLGVVGGERVLAAANVSVPRPAGAPPSLAPRYQLLCDRLGSNAIRRFDAFAEVSSGFEPDTPHYMLGMIGVRHESQGKGYARLLLDEVHALSANDPDSTGVVLTTELPKNVPLYEHFGYGILGRAQVGELTTWMLFRPD